MSAQDLSNACTELGMSFSRSAIANLESGRRPLLSVAELLVFSKALGVPPLLLALPLGRPDAGEVEILPGVMLDTWEAAKWFTGEQAFTQNDGEGWFSWQPDQEAWKESSMPLRTYRQHEEYVIEWKNTLRRTDAQRRVANSSSDPAEREANLLQAEQGDARIRAIEKELSRLRETMRNHEITPPELDEVMEHIDTAGAHTVTVRKRPAGEGSAP